MLITFKSSAAADVLMYQMHAKPLLDLLGKNIDQGIITAQEMPAAIRRLEAEIALSKHAPSPSPTDDGTHTAGEDDDVSAGNQVSFGARAFPLLEMMRAARDKDTFVMWGV